MLILTFLLLWQTAEGGSSSGTLEIVKTVLTFLSPILTLIIGWMVGRKKNNAEVKGIEKKAEIEEKTADSNEYDKAVKRFNDATDKMVELSKLLVDCRESNNSLTSENFLWQKKEQFWLQEKQQLENSLSNAGTEINVKNQIIVDLREELQGLKNGTK